MAIKVIVAGVSKTGTESMSQALEILGYGKCFHGFELIRNGRNLDYFHELWKTGTFNLEKIFDGFQSVSDIPAYCHFHDLTAAYPDAKIILTVRDLDSWFASVSATVFMNFPKVVTWISRPLGRIFSSMEVFNKILAYRQDAVFNGFFQGKWNDPEEAKLIVKRWNEYLVSTIPSNKLLVHSFDHGWEPLCRFLGKPVPDIPYPHTNDRMEFYKTLDSIFPFLISSNKVRKKNM